MDDDGNIHDSYVYLRMVAIYNDDIDDQIFIVKEDQVNANIYYAYHDHDNFDDQDNAQEMDNDDNIMDVSVHSDTKENAEDLQVCKDAMVVATVANQVYADDANSMDVNFRMDDDVLDKAFQAPNDQVQVDEDIFYVTKVNANITNQVDNCSMDDYQVSTTINALDIN